jgi:hypothetical protein
MTLMGCASLVIAIAVTDGMAGPKGKSLRKQVRAVLVDVPDLDIRLRLFESPTFRHLWENSSGYGSDAIALLADEAVPEPEKIVSVLAMQHLPKEEYLRFIRRVLDLRIAGEISQAVFLQAVFPGYDWSTLLQEGYQEERIRQILFRVRDNRLLPKDGPGFNEHYLAEVLSGEVASYIAEMRASGQMPTRRTPKQ